MSFLDFIVEQGQVKTDTSKVKVVAELPIPTFRKQLQCFNFIRDNSKLVGPLTKLTATSSLSKLSFEAKKSKKKVVL